MSEENEVAVSEKTICGLTEDKISKIEEISKKFQLDTFNPDIEDELKKSLLVAQGMSALQEIITEDVMQPIMFLMGSKLGFRTDRDLETKKYSVAEIKPVFIEALLNGLMPAGNQFNVIATGLYITKEGFTALFKKMPGFTDFVYEHELLDKTIGKNSIVKFNAKWKLNGVEDSLSGEIPVHTYSTDKVDNIMGKAERKLKYRVHCQVTQTEATVGGEADASDPGSKNAKKPTALEDRAAKVKADAAKGGKAK